MAQKDRSRFQFRMGTLFVLVTWLALALGLSKWFGRVWGVVPLLVALICLAVLIHCAYFRRVKRLALLLLVLGGVWLLHSHFAGYWGMIAKPVGCLADGPLVLNVEGAGYGKGDVVWINTVTGKLTRGDAILFRWKTMKGVEPNVGPEYAIGEIAAVPGDTLDMAEIGEYRGRDGSRRGAWAATFHARGAHSDSGTLVLPSGDFLVETKSSVMVVDAASISAVVVVKLGHDDRAEREFRKTIY